MGRHFIGHSGGRGKLYGCKKCFTFVTCHSELTSPHFTGGTGPAMLFRRAWNVGHGEIERKKMLTGWHMVRDVFCILCKARLGWMYEIAYENDQIYKEKQVILENALICKISDEIRDPLGENGNNHYVKPNLEEPHGRSPWGSSRNSSRSNSESGSAGSISTNSL